MHKVAHVQWEKKDFLRMNGNDLKRLVFFDKKNFRPSVIPPEHVQSKSLPSSKRILPSSKRI